MSRTIRRAELLGYLFFLWGIYMIVNWGLVDISSSMTLETVAGIAAIGMGLCASAGGVLMYLNPDGIEKGSDPAPGYMFIIAGIGTVAFVITTVLSIAIETDVW